MKQKIDLGDVFYNSKESHRDTKKHKETILNEERRVKRKFVEEVGSYEYYKCPYCNEWYTPDLCCDCQEDT